MNDSYFRVVRERFVLIIIFARSFSSHSWTIYFLWIFQEPFVLIKSFANDCRSMCFDSFFKVKITLHVFLVLKDSIVHFVNDSFKFGRSWTIRVSIWVHSLFKNNLIRIFWSSFTMSFVNDSLRIIRVVRERFTQNYSSRSWTIHFYLIVEIDGTCERFSSMITCLTPNWMFIQHIYTLNDVFGLEFAKTVLSFVNDSFKNWFNHSRNKELPRIIHWLSFIISIVVYSISWFYLIQNS